MRKDGQDEGISILKFLDGMHCFDEICGELGVGEKTIEARVKGGGSRGGEGLGVIVHR